jgi:glycosyltransferase involved in cell wall biosynthesis
VRNVSAVPTGVDIDYFAPPSQPAQVAELAFVGSMDWMPNIDGMRWFIEEILPRIRARQPHCRLAIIGRSPTREMEMLARRDPLLQLTGTVPDIRPFLWGSTLSVVPLRIGGGTRLKIYESMAAQVPVVSTTIGAEGLPLRDGEHLYLADDPDTFAARCLTLLDDQARRRQMADTAWQFVAGSFSWDAVARQFEALLAQAPNWRASMK